MSADGTAEITEVGNEELAKVQEIPGIQIMSREFGEQNPQTGESVYYSSREERIQYAQDLIAEGKVKVTMAEPFRNLNIMPDLLASLLVNVWLLPNAELGNELPFQAKTGHQASSASLIVDLNLPSHKGRFDIVAKPIPNFQKAKNEEAFFSECLKRGIKTIEPFGTVMINNELGHSAYNLTLLKHGVVPLSVIRLEGIRITQGDGKVRNLLKGLGAFVANFNNRGLGHGDLHSGNVGADSSTGSSENFVLFDLERAQLLNLHTLKEKKAFGKHIPPHMQGFQNTETLYVKDLARLISYLVVENQDGIPAEVIRKEVLEGYLENRDREQGQLSAEEFNRVFEGFYQKNLKAATRSQEKTRALRQSKEPTT